MERPLIGITCDLEVNPSGRPYAKCYLAYVNAVALAGGCPVCVPPHRDDDHPEAFLDRVKGLVIPGGDDFPGTLFGEADHPALVPAHTERIAFDLHLVQAALVRDLPILGVCYGAQALNLALGGSLIQDIPSEIPGALPHKGTREGPAAWHDVEITPNSILHGVFGPTVRINSFHHQAIKRVGRGLRVTARSADGVIEAVEAPDHRFVVGVQWHPERAGASPLFGALLRAAAGGGD